MLGVFIPIKMILKFFYDFFFSPFLGLLIENNFILCDGYTMILILEFIDTSIS